MVPSVFISSSIQDLHHLRDSIREAISSLEYSPVMSDYGDIGYLPTTSAEASCYNTMRDCDLAVLIVGKHYGTKSERGLSVTHNEMRTEIKKGIKSLSRDYWVR